VAASDRSRTDSRETDTGVTARVDRWLWAVRIVKSRTEATEACGGGHVKVNGRTAKAATTVRVGDRVEAFVHRRQRVLEVVRPIEVRVGAPIAAECLVDHSPPPPSEEERTLKPLFGAGRPTKHERRRLEQIRARKRGR